MIENIIRFSIKNKVVIGVFTGILIIWGIWSATKLPIDALPDITNNQVQIYTVSPTLAGQEVEQLVTFPIEQSLVNIPDLKEMRSISRFGLSVVTVVFEDNVDIYFARQLVLEKLKEAEENIPQGVGKPELVPVSTGLGEIYQYTIHPIASSEDKYSARDLREMQDWIVARQLYGTKGIAEVNSFGGELKQYEVAINPFRLKSVGVSINDIFSALEKNNQNTGGAYIEKDPKAYFIRGIGLVNSLEEVKNIAVKNEVGSVPIFIRDVADVRLGHAIRYGAMTYNGEKEVVGGIVMMLKGENSNEVVQRVKAKIPEIQKMLPKDVVVEPFLERTDLVNRAIHTVEKNLTEGALIVIFVLVLFLGNLRAGLIVASAIPISLLFALGMMNVFGVSANLMSLGAIDFGLIVDGAVIITEATLHLLQTRNFKHRLTTTEMDEAVGESANKMMHSAVFGQIIILIVYIPILSLSGVEGKMFKPMAQTVSFAIIGATILSLTYIPMMCSVFLSKNTVKKENFSDKMVHKLQKIYQPFLAFAMKFKRTFITSTIILFGISLLLFKNMGAEFIPQLQEGDFAYHCILPPGSSLSQSIKTSMQAERIIKQFDEVKAVIGKTGSAEVPTDPMPPEASDLVITLKPRSEWKRDISYEELSKEIMTKLEVIPGVFFESNQPIQMRFNELMTGVRQDVAVKIFGENLDSLSIYAKKVSAVVQAIDGVSAPQVEQVDGLPQIDVQYDRTRLANYNLTVNDANDVLSAAFAGKIAGRVYENERHFDLVVRLDSSFRKDIDNVRNLMIALPDGNQIPFSQIATINYKSGPAQISREQGKRRIVIGFNVEGRDIQSVVAEVQQKLNAEITLPTGYYFTFGGQFENLQEATARLSIAVPVALLLIFLLLYFTFRSLKEALLIFTAIPMSAIGGVFALWLRGMPFSISAGIGFIALFGVAVLNGIVLISTFNQLKKEGWENLKERVIEGTKIRMRPVLMTATVASLGFLPMAISTSAGAEVQKPLATVVIGGLVSATFLTLIVLPLLYLLFNSKISIKNKKMMKTTLIVLGIISFLSFSTTVAQKRTISIDDAIQIALENNGLVKAGKAEIGAAQQLVKTSGMLPKLGVEANFGNYNSVNFDESFQISQTIPFPTIFGARKQYFSSNLKQKELQNEQQLLELKTNIREAYYQTAFLQQNQLQFHFLDSLLTHFVAVSEKRYQSGEIKLLEVTTAKAKAGEIRLQMQQNDVELQKSYANLAVLMNFKEDFIISPDFQPLEVETILDSSVIANHPYIQSLLQTSQMTLQQMKVEKAENLPDLIVGYTNQSLIGVQEINGKNMYFDARKRFNSFNVGITIPLFSGTMARVKSLNFERKAIEEKASQQQREWITAWQNALQQYEQDKKQYEYYKNQAQQNSQEIIQDAQLNFETGEIGYVEYLFALQTATEIQTNYLKSIQQLNRSALKIYYFIHK